MHNTPSHAAAPSLPSVLRPCTAYRPHPPPHPGSHPPTQDLCAAVAAGVPCSLLDEVHVCILRTLACYETPEQRERRALDLSHLDQVGTVGGVQLLLHAMRMHGMSSHEAAMHGMAPCALTPHVHNACLHACMLTVRRALLWLSSDRPCRAVPAHDVVRSHGPSSCGSGWS